MFVHLTNYSVNKENPNFKVPMSKKADYGHKRSWITVLKRLHREGNDVDLLKSCIKDIIIKTMLTIQPDLVHNYKICRPREKDPKKFSNKMCFELLGFDIILDKKCKPYLLEVNHAPSFTCDASIDYEIKYKLIKDTLKLLNLDITQRRKIIQNLYDEK